jgi:hypothetical protein
VRQVRPPGIEAWQLEHAGEKAARTEDAGEVSHGITELDYTHEPKPLAQHVGRAAHAIVARARMQMRMRMKPSVEVSLHVR